HPPAPARDDPAVRAGGRGRPGDRGAARRAPGHAAGEAARLPDHLGGAVRLRDAAVLLGDAADRPVLPDDPDPAPAGTAGLRSGDILADWKGLILPVGTLAIATLAAYTRYVRSTMIDNLQENYIRTARAKGLPGSRVVIRHALRNSLFPVISLLGMYIPVLFSGALVVEQLFNYPGMGLMF